MGIEFQCRLEEEKSNFNPFSQVSQLEIESPTESHICITLSHIHLSSTDFKCCSVLMKYYTCIYLMEKYSNKLHESPNSSQFLVNGEAFLVNGKAALTLPNTGV